MSDLADQAEAAEAVLFAGGVFAARNRCAPAPERVPLVCACGGRPSYSAYPVRVAGRPAEKLACAGCGREVGPLSSRHALAAAWRLSGGRV